MIICCVLAAVMMLTGCKSSALNLAYDLDTSNNSYKVSSGAGDLLVAQPFAKNLCVSDNNLNTMAVQIESAEAGGLFDITSTDTIYAKNIHELKNPASLTKVMTAYIALKYGHLDDILTASANVKIKESGAQLMGLNEGDKMTLEQALYALLIYSANDSAVMIAEYLSGSVESFAAVMNEEAKKIGATNTHFDNPHGLTSDEHLTTAYDLYLIFNAAMQYEEFRKIINTNEYQVTYKDRDGNPKSKDIKNTNGYINGTCDSPENVTVIGGKTGTTKAAGSCLILLSSGTNGHTYVSVILHDEDHDTLYKNMTSILTDIP